MLPPSEGARGPQLQRLQRLWPALLLVLGLSLSALAAWQQSQDNLQARQAALRQDTERLADELGERMSRFELGLRGARSVVLAVGEDQLDRASFARYARARDLPAEYPGARGFGFIRRVAAADLPAFTAAAAADGWRSFSLRQLQPDTAEHRGEHQGEHFIIQYIEPVAGNAAAVGLDIASEPRRREAALAAARRDAATISQPITLVQATGAVQQAFLVLLPVLGAADPLPTPQARWAATVGWVYAPLVGADMVKGLHLPTGVRLSLRDVGSDEALATTAGPGPASAPAITTAAAAPQPFYGPATAARDEQTATVQRTVLGRRWQMGVHAGPAYFAQLQQTSAGAVLLTGSLLSMLATALLAAQNKVRRNRRLALQDQQRLAALVAQSSDAIVTEDLQGRVTGWNRSAERLFGHGLKQALGRSLAELLLPTPDHAGAERERLAALDGQGPPARDMIALHRDGRLCEVSQVITPLRGADGQVVGLGRTLRDVHERARAERERSAFTAELERQVSERTAQLDAARQQLQTVFDALPSLVAYWDSELVLRTANLAYHQWFGAPAGSLLGSPVHELLSAELLQTYLPRMRAALAGAEQRFDITGPAPAGGEVRHMQGRYLPDRRVDGTVSGLFVLVHDVTEIDESRRRLADALRQNEALVHTLRSHTLYSVTDAEGRIIEVNDGFCSATGYSREELLGRSHKLIGSGVHPPEFWAGMWRALVRGQAWHGQLCNRHRSGRLVWMDTMIAPFLGPDGEVQRYVAIRHDITDSRAAAQALASERERLHNVLRGTDLGTWEWNVQTGEAHFDERWAQFTGHRLAELQPTSIETWRSLVHPEDLQRSRELLPRHYSGELPYYECEVRLRHRDGHWVWVLGRGRLFTRTADGQPEWMYGTHQDVSARRATEQALRLATHEAEAASKAKSAFLANMSHEVRTPLNAMMGLSALLAHSGLDGAQQRLLTQIQRASQSLLVVVNDVLDLAKIEAGEMRLEQLPFALAERVQAVADLHGPPARAKGLQFTLQMAPELPRWVRGDPTRLDQMLHNLLANAVKFTAAGQVRLQVQEDPGPVPATPSARLGQADAAAPGSEATPLWLRIEVHDTGIGIAVADQQAIFEPFAQADVSTTRRFGGTGLGLSIVRQVCSLMGGELGVHSQPGEGSCFWLRLPLGRVDAATAAQLAAGRGTPGEQPPPPRAAATSLRSPRLGGVHVLVVDDSDINRDIAQRLLEVEGAHTRGCASAPEALALLQAGSPAVDAVLMDVQMPGMDGLEATRRLRRLPGLAQLPVVALTAGALPQQREQALAAGMNAFLSKPLDPATLVQTLRRMLDGASGPALPGATAPAGHTDTAGPASASASDDTNLTNHTVGTTTATADWPQLPGVDSAGAARRLDGDLPLFTRLLARLLREFDDLGTAPRPAAPQGADVEPQAMQALAARAHKLRGSASLLGATTVQAAAERLETLLRTAQPSPVRVARRRQALAGALRQLRQASAPLLQDLGAAGECAAAPSAADALLLRRLRKQLQGNELAAQHTLLTLGPALRSCWPAHAVSQLVAAVDQLDFRQALAVLDAQSPSTAGGAAPATVAAGDTGPDVASDVASGAASDVASDVASGAASNAASDAPPAIPTRA